VQSQGKKKKKDPPRRACRIAESLSQHSKAHPRAPQRARCTERERERESGSEHLICSKYTSGTCTQGPFSVQVASMILLPPSSSSKAKWLLLLLLLSLFSFSLSLFFFLGFFNEELTEPDKTSCTSQLV